MRVRFHDARRGAIAGTLELVGILLLMLAAAVVVVYATSAREPLTDFGSIVNSAVEQMKAGYNRIAG